MSDVADPTATPAAAIHEGDVSAICEAFVWIVRDSGSTAGPIAVPLRDLTQRQWDQLVQRLGPAARRKNRAALEGMP